MTTNRNILEDRRKTQERIQDITNNPDKEGKNWLGHRSFSGAAEVNQLLLHGATIEELVNTKRTTRSSVEQHLKHLENEHGLVISKQIILRFVQNGEK